MLGILLLSFMILSSQTVVDKQIRFNSEGKLKIMQFTDLHFGDSDQVNQDNVKIMSALLDAEQPDLVVVTGDMVSGYEWDGYTQGWYAQQYKYFTVPMTERQIYWAVTGGNHDGQADLSRDQVSELDRSYNYSLTQPNAANMSHTFNYKLPIYSNDGSNDVMRLWFLDSGDSNCLEWGGYDCVRPDQLEWLRQEQSQYKGQGQTDMVLLHIPLQEYMNIYNNFQFIGSKKNAFGCSALNTGLVSVLKESNITQWVLCGHDHDNDFYGLFDNIYIGYGRKSGYGCYGPDYFQRGARMFEIQQDPFDIKTWIRQEDLTTTDQGESHTKDPNDQFEVQCYGAGQIMQLHQKEDTFFLGL